jgi:Na+/proline symporter
MNTAFVFALLLVITFTLYLTDNVLGGPSGIYDRLAEVSAHSPVIGNAGGSYLTMASLEGGSPVPLMRCPHASCDHSQQRTPHTPGFFGIINIVVNFGTVFVDQVRRQTLLKSW